MFTANFLKGNQVSRVSPMCTAMIALVRRVMAASANLGSMQ
jgi:hypothetical protein